MIDFNGENISLTELGAMCARSEHSFGMLKREWVSSYEDFVETVYNTLDKALAKLEENPQYYFPQDVGEDKITHDIANMMSMAGFDARQGQTQGGNIDLTVKGRDSAWSWIGEAKIFKDNTSLREGMLQLSTRYRNASPIHTQAGILAYTKRKDAAGCLKEWQGELNSMQLDDFAIDACNRRGPLAFYSTHKHEATGMPIRVRHTAIVLYHLPKDRSGRTAAKYQGAHESETGKSVKKKPAKKPKAPT